MMISDQDIQKAKKTTNYGSYEEAHHEHNDCIRIAFAWLDAQTKTKGSMRKTFPIKHIIEKWGGRYVSTTDVMVAAHMHPDVKGEYPYFNISSRLTEPSKERLEGIAEAFTQGYHERYDPSVYSQKE